MQLEQSFTLPFPRAAVWPAFADVPMLVACMPGAGLIGEPRMVEGGADLDLNFAVKLGPIAGTFQGQGAIRRDDSAFSGTFSGSGADRKSGSRVKGSANFSLMEVALAETRVEVAVEYSLTGSLAQFSRGAIVKELAAAMTRDFAANLQARIAEAQPARATQNTDEEALGVAPTDAPAFLAMPVAEPRRVSVHGAQPAVQPLNAAKLLWRVVWARILGIFGRSVG